MKFKIINTVLGLGFLLAGCTDNTTNTIKGIWTVDSLEYNGQNIMNCVLVNMIFFNDGNKASFPFSDNTCDSLFKAPSYISNQVIEDKRNGNCHWKVLLNKPYPVTLVLQSDVEAYIGTHRVQFYRDDPPNEAQLMMDITGVKLHMICRRSGLIDRSSAKYQKDIDELIKMSNPRSLNHLQPSNSQPHP